MDSGITVIIPNRNHAARLERCLRAITHQSFPAEKTEVIVVDNGSTDNSVEIARSFNVQVLEVPSPQTPYAARNAGIAAARMSHLAFLDSTCTPCYNYLEELVATAESSEAELVVGNIEFEFSPKPSIGEAIDALTFMRNHEYLKNRFAFPGNSLFCSRKTMDEIGVFRADLRSGGDGEWTKRFAKDNRIVAYAAKAVVLYPAKSFSGIIKKAVRIGKGHGKLMREEKELNVGKIFLEMRPPSLKFLQQVIYERGLPEFQNSKMPIWFGLWVFRIAYGYGKLVRE